jgi:hypothetical protein
MKTLLLISVVCAALDCAAQFASPSDLAFNSRRRVDPTEPPFTNTAGLVVWLKPQSLPSGGSVVTTWTDSSGSNNHFTNTAALGPFSVAGALNGYKSARFFGTNLLNAPAVINVGTDNSVVFVVKTYETTGNNYQLLGSGGFDFSWTINNDDGLSIVDDGSAGIKRSDVASPITLSGFSYLEWTRQDAESPNAVFYQNTTSLGLTTGDTALGADSTIDRLCDGAEWEVVEVFVWTHHMTTDERAGLRIYLSAKFGL